MFQLTDNFISHDYNLQPYSFEIERHTGTENLHTGVHDGYFHLKSIGNRYILRTPAIRTGKLEFDMQFNYMQEHDPYFTVFFQYNKQTRSGMGVRVRCHLTGGLTVELVKEQDNHTTAVATLKADDFTVGEMESKHLCVELGDDFVTCAVEDKRFSFAYRPETGYIALERENFMGEMIISNLQFQSEDELETKTVLEPLTVDIPLTNGGNIPYQVTWQVEQIGESYFMKATLGGGTKSREWKERTRPGQYGVEHDFMTAPYVGLSNGGEDRIFYLSNGENVFIDPNIVWTCLLSYHGDVDLPITRQFQIEGSWIGADTQLIFGYENLQCNGYSPQAGGREFRYDRAGNLLYNNIAPNGQDIFELESPADKFAMSFIPEDCYRREDVEAHIRNNHYFERNERIHFLFKLHTKLDTDYLTVNASLVDVYETKALATCQPAIQVAEGEYGYKVLSAEMDFDSLEVGVYKAQFEVLYGGQPYQKKLFTFEVFDKDTDENPALKSGLPFIFSMANEQRFLERDNFDPWIPFPSNNLLHYIVCTTNAPDEAVQRKVWRLLKPFKRKWYPWIQPRTCDNTADARYLDIIRHADYLDSQMVDYSDPENPKKTPFYSRSDLTNYRVAKQDHHWETLQRFLAENRDVAEAIDFNFETLEFTPEQFKILLRDYFTRWRDYYNEAAREQYAWQNEQWKKYNPNIKRSAYGPFPIYGGTTLTYYSLGFGNCANDERLAESKYTGFAVYEDYPLSCAYHTYRGSFSLMTMLLHAPNLTMYPEQYKTVSRGGCIDGAVKFAHAPMGERHHTPDFTATHSFEFVFNTPHKTKNGYRYWDTYGFHRRDYGVEMEELVLAWKYVVQNKPKSPMKSLAFIVEYPDSDTTLHSTYNGRWGSPSNNLNNQSELGSFLIHESSREAGLPNGFGLKFDTLEDLTADECDVIVVPSLQDADPKYVQELRRLHSQGVRLFAVSDVTGLEDLFGVCRDEKTCTVTTVSYQGETENVYNTEAKFRYRPCGAETVLEANGMPALLCTDTTALLNTSVVSLGAEKLEQILANPLNTGVIGELLRRAVRDMLCKLSQPLAKGENVGVTLFNTEDGRKELLAINYTPYDNHEFELIGRQAVVRFNMPNLTDVKSDRPVFVGKKDGIVKEIRFDMKAYESAFIELITD